MKKAMLFIVLVCAMVSGCEQRQQPKGGQPVVPGAAPMISPGEIKQLEQIAAQSPKNADAWIALGNALMDSGRYAEAANAYGKALELDPRNVNVRVDMGTCLKNSGKPEQAVEEYQKAIKINPNHLNAHRNMAVVLAFDLHKKKEAISEFEKYLQLAPNAPDAAEIRQQVQQLKSSQ
jgi:tetratricopeptide (TPR) repeat protein